jgi:hypothetical protein
VGQWAEAGFLSSELGDIEYWAVLAMLTLAVVGIAATLWWNRFPPSKEPTRP